MTGPVGSQRKFASPCQVVYGRRGPTGKAKPQTERSAQRRGMAKKKSSSRAERTAAAQRRRPESRPQSGRRTGRRRERAETAREQREQERRARRSASRPGRFGRGCVARAETVFFRLGDLFVGRVVVHVQRFRGCDWLAVYVLGLRCSGLDNTLLGVGWFDGFVKMMV